MFKLNQLGLRMNGFMSCLLFLIATRKPNVFYEIVADNYFHPALNYRLCRLPSLDSYVETLNEGCYDSIRQIVLPTWTSFLRLWKGTRTYDFPNLQVTLSYYIYFWLAGKMLYELQIVAIMELQTLYVYIFSLKGLPKRKALVLHLVGNRGIALSESAYHLKCHTGGFSLTFSF